MSTAVTILFAVHNKGQKCHDPGTWRGVLARHWNSIDLVPTKVPGSKKPPHNFQGYVYDPAFGSKDITLNEIEGRLLEVWFTSTRPLAPWRAYDNDPNQRRTDIGAKLSIMIDDKARNGTMPHYGKGDLAFMVGLASWTIDRKTWPKEVVNNSPMLMSAIWRDNFNPCWEVWKDPNNVECDLIPMYFITETPYDKICQKRPDYKHGVPAPAQTGSPLVTQTGNKSTAKINPDGTVSPDDDSVVPDAIVPVEEPAVLDADSFGGETVDAVMEALDAAADGDEIELSAIDTGELGLHL